MQGPSLTIDSERFLALENVLRELSRRVNYMDEWHGVENAWDDGFATCEKRMSALEVKVSSLQAPLGMEPKSSSLAVFGKYLAFFAWIKEVQRRAGEETMAERRLRHLQREENKKRRLSRPIVGVRSKVRLTSDKCSTLGPRL